MHNVLSRSPGRESHACQVLGRSGRADDGVVRQRKQRDPTAVASKVLKKCNLHLLPALSHTPPCFCTRSFRDFCNLYSTSSGIHPVYRRQFWFTELWEQPYRRIGTFDVRPRSGTVLSKNLTNRTDASSNEHLRTHILEAAPCDPGRRIIPADRSTYYCRIVFLATSSAPTFFDQYQSARTTLFHSLSYREAATCSYGTITIDPFHVELPTSKHTYALSIVQRLIFAAFANIYWLPRHFCKLIAGLVRTFRSSTSFAHRVTNITWQPCATNLL